MAFKYNKIQDTDYVKSVSTSLNAVGAYLQSMSEERDTLPIYSQLVVTESASKLQTNVVYYLTNAQGIPQRLGVSANGYGMLLRRNPSTNYYTFVFLPYNSSIVIYRICNNGVWQDWQSTLTTENTTNYQKYAFTDEQGQVNNNKSVDVKTNVGYSKSKGTLVNAPVKDSTGWIDFSDTKDGEASQTIFNPTDSTSFFTKQKKAKSVTQNPNIIQDALFTTFIANTYTFNNDTILWGTLKDQARVIQQDLKFKGQNVVEINDNTTTNYPTMRGRALTIGSGKDLQVGSTYTMSVYVMTPSVAKLKSNQPYIEVSYPSSLTDSTNPSSNSQLYITGLKDNEWQRVSFTFTVPEGKTIARPNLRLNTTTSGQKNGALVYYALPKLEVGSTVTPFITNTKDTKQFDELWSNWNEYVSKEQLQEYVPTDITSTQNGVKYFLSTKVLSDLGVDFYEYIKDIKQGFHTFYLASGAPGNPSKGSLRGTLLVDYSMNGGFNELLSTEKYVTVDATDYYGVHYSIYYNTVAGTKRIRQSVMQTLLWEGSLDGSKKTSITLNEDYKSFKALDITVFFSYSGTYRTIRVFPEPTASGIVLRDVNLSDGETGLNFTGYELGLEFPDNFSIRPLRIKRIDYNMVNNTQNLAWNQEGDAIITKVIGVHTV